MEKPKTIKAWAIVWKKKSAEAYGTEENELLPIEPERDYWTQKRYKAKKGKRFFYIDCLSVFANKFEAECWRDKNKDWKVVTCTITINQSKRKCQNPKKYGH